MGLATAAKTDAIAGSSRKHERGHFLRLGLVRLTDYAILIFIGGVSSVPLIWMTSTSLKETGREFVFPPQIIPDPIVWLNYRDVWSVTHMHQFGLNSILVAVFATIGTVLTCSLVAFGFARIDFPAKNSLFFLLISTLMLPGIITLVPTFVLFRLMGLINNPLALIVPWWFGGGAFGAAFYVFLMRQFMLQLPRELDEAALADGATYFRIYWNIILPLSGPALATSAIFSILHHWNDFLAPLIFINSERWRTMALALRFFLEDETSHGAGGGRWNLLMASAVLMLIPILVLFFSLQKYFIRGIAFTGLAGR
ncbi:MAG: carbohydrate ABC transporter permease [Chloroflexi bacterium]|nr:carbohydrate ABC transporter permease [Chloroflexota bacterium]MCY3938715.1 carbohydrate ABC transporter permease [Chloroflexota bacterium]